MGGVADAAIDMAKALERNFTINFGPHHPARTRSCDLSWNSTARWWNVSIRILACFTAAPTPMNQEHAYVLQRRSFWASKCPGGAKLIRVLYSEIGRLLSHLLSPTLSWRPRRLA